jgi:hypothetical protein
MPDDFAVLVLALGVHLNGDTTEQSPLICTHRTWVRDGLVIRERAGDGSIGDGKVAGRALENAVVHFYSSSLTGKGA